MTEDGAVEFWIPLLALGLCNLRQVTSCLWASVFSYSKSPRDLEQGFSTLALVTFGAGSFYCGGGCFVHCAMFGSIPGLYPVGASSKPSLLPKL